MPPDYIDLRVTPRAKHARIEHVGDNSYHIWVSEPPEDGKATRAALAALAQALGVPKTALYLVQGAKSRTKRVQVLA